MRRLTCISWLACALAVAACDDAGDSPGPGVVELRMEVEVGVRSVTVTSREVARPCTCTAGEFFEPGRCGGHSDGLACDCTPPPADCLEEVIFERAGVEVHRDDIDSFLGTTRVRLDDPIGDDGMLILRGCGDEARIAIDATGIPTTTIDGYRDEDSAFLIDWSASNGAETALVSLGDGFVTTECHTADRVVSFDPTSYWFADTAYLSARAFAAPETVETGLGTARVWAGEGDSMMVSISR